jgi:hypothetical protein
MRFEAYTSDNGLLISRFRKTSIGAIRDGGYVYTYNQDYQSSDDAQNPTRKTVVIVLIDIFPWIGGI